MTYEIVVTQSMAHSLFTLILTFFSPLALKQMMRRACPHQQVLYSLVELDLAADHVVRG